MVLILLTICVMLFLRFLDSKSKNRQMFKGRIGSIPMFRGCSFFLARSTFAVVHILHYLHQVEAEDLTRTLNP